MSAHVTVFCRKSVAGLTVAQFREELAEADLYTLAESLNLPEGEEAAVEAMQKVLRIEAKKGAEFNRAELHWKAKGRPIQIERVSDDAARAERDELLSVGLPASKSAGAKKVRAHLKDCVEIVDFEMGLDDSNQLAATLSEVLAFFIAERGDGLVFFFERDWASPADRGTNLWSV